MAEKTLFQKYIESKEPGRPGSHVIPEDLTGRKFGDLVVVEFAGRRNKEMWWMCACVCGETVEVKANRLRHWNTPARNCGASKPQHSKAYDKDAITHRFFQCVDKTGPNGCWLWTGRTMYSGYGVFHATRKLVASHRFSYRYHKGDIPANAEVMHSCDTRNCVNPEHLSLGTHKDNMRDMKEKDRGSRIICNADATEIKRTLATESYRGLNTDLANAYGVGLSAISSIKYGRSFSHIPWPPGHAGFKPGKKK